MIHKFNTPKKKKNIQIRRMETAIPQKNDWPTWLFYQRHGNWHQCSEAERWKRLRLVHRGRLEHSRRHVQGLWHLWWRAMCHCRSRLTVEHNRNWTFTRVADTLSPRWQGGSTTVLWAALQCQCPNSKTSLSRSGMNPSSNMIMWLTSRCTGTYWTVHSPTASSKQQW